MNCLFFEGMGNDSGERSLKAPTETLPDSHKQDGKNQQELIHWHDRWVN